MGIKKSIITDFSSGTPSSTYSVATGYSVGSEWINTNNGNRFYHKTDGNWVPLNVESVFYVQGGTSSAFDTTSAIYRTGSLNIGTGTASDSRFVVSSSGGTNSLVVGENGGVSIGGALSSYPLKVYGTAEVTGFFYTNVTQVSTAIIFDGAGYSGIKKNTGLDFFTYGTSSTIRFTNNSYGISSGETTMLVDTTKKYVGIGTASPSTKLHIYATQSGAFRLEDGAQSYPGYVLTSDANGVGTWQGNTQVRITTATATALPSWNNTTIMCDRSGTSIITIPDTGLPPNFSFRFIVISTNTSATLAFTYSSPAVSILPNTLLTFAQYESGVIDRLGTSSNYYITY